MPDYDLKSLVSLLGSVHGFKCAFQQTEELYACACADINQYKEKFPPLKITLSETNTYEVPYTEYTVRQNNLCYLTIMPLGEQDYWILGDSFLRNYYAIFDIDGLRVGLAGSSIQEPFQMTFTMIAAMVGMALMILVILRIVCLSCKKQTR